MVREYEDGELIEKFQSMWNSPVLLVKKKDDQGNETDVRFVVDYRKLNQMSEIQNFPIPLIDDTLTGLNGCNYFTTLDIKSAFHQIVVEESSRDCTAFTVNQFKYRWVWHAIWFGVSSTNMAASY